MEFVLHREAFHGAFTGEFNFWFRPQKIDGVCEAVATTRHRVGYALVMKRKQKECPAKTPFKILGRVLKLYR
jgi:hypothetical protein